MIVVAVIGVPGTGKSTLIRRWMRLRKWACETPLELLDSHVGGDGIRVLGKYEQGEVFCGTDRLSMAIHPKVVEYLSDNNDRAVVFEGDRLTSVKLFETAVELGHRLHVIELTTSCEELRDRYAKRGSNQSPSFIKGCATKIENVKAQFKVETFDNTEDYQTVLIADHIERIITKTLPVRVCVKCNVEKSIEDFPKHKTSEGGRLRTCKKCRHEYIKLYRARNGDKINETRRRTYNDKKARDVSTFLTSLREFKFRKSRRRPSLLQPGETKFEYVTLGIINNREGTMLKYNLPKKDLSRKTKIPRYYRLYTEAKELMHMKDPGFNFTSIVINKNHMAAKHKDKNNIGESYITALGDYTGGELRVWNKEETAFTDHDIKNKWLRFNGAEHFHETLPFEGERYSIVYYTV